MKAQTSTRPDIVARKKLGLDWSPAQRNAYLKDVKVVDIKRLDQPYPVDDHYVAGTPKAREQWSDYWHEKPMKDRRYRHGIRPKILDLDESRLQYIIPQSESVIFRDADTKELVMVVLRSFMPDEGVRGTMVELCKDILKARRNDRREDPGMLVHFGYTCGSRHDPQIQLAAPCVRLNTVAKQQSEEQLNIRAQGMAGLTWNMMKSRLPLEITATYNDMIEAYDLPRMDMGRDDDAFTFQLKGQDVTFQGLELPPPSGLSAINYARHTHTETNGDNWIVACTCNAPDDPTKGGNFYIASYGIMMEPATNTVSAWHPPDYHGTSLYEMTEGPERRAGYEIRTELQHRHGVRNVKSIEECTEELCLARRTTQDERTETSAGSCKKEHTDEVFPPLENGSCIQNKTVGITMPASRHIRMVGQHRMQ
ncbi:Uu.00g080060.m01.CDS01 [Anthostomella pinea]|uniref:Uu.00g080060.m01.CDS01 n=1 Tax=Anthostomella pinea TaxID=933095 RepID=A0AAI8VM25_9PEZI|nr:Uu.00g080060.m01.CDS01 [Anthostomella pinea]